VPAGASKHARGLDKIRTPLRVDARRPKHERRTARALHAEIKAQQNLARTNSKCKP
jgi:hypothetical protein